MATKILLKNENKETQTNKDPLTTNITILGRGECGKTSLISRFLNGKHLTGFAATTIETTTNKWIGRDGKERTMNIFDTSGQEDYSRLRTITLPFSDYIILAYSIVDRESYSEVLSTLQDMVKTKCKSEIKVILVATKSDLRNSYDAISNEEGRCLKDELDAVRFYECSALTGDGVNEIFEFVKKDFEGKEEKGFFKRLCCFN